MAQVKFTNHYLKAALMNATDELFGGSVGFGGTLADSGVAQLTPSAANRLVIYKGIPPPDSWLVNTSTVGQRGNGVLRPTEVLLTIDYRVLFEGLIDGAFCFKESAFFAASASGTATWAALYAWNSSINSCTIFCDVSDLNGNGLIKLPSVEIVKDDRYNMKPMKLVFPNEFSY